MYISNKYMNVITQNRHYIFSTPKYKIEDS